MDRTAMKTLFDTYWCAKGWLPEKQRTTPPAAFAKAKAAGIMFDSCYVTHDELVSRGHHAVTRISRDSVVSAFLASLSTRRLELRSALASWVYLEKLPAHSHSNVGRCNVCGCFNEPNKAQDLNVLNFERFKWGGVRHGDLQFAVFDLETFLDLKGPEPQKEDFKLFSGIISAIQKVPSNTTAANLQKSIPKELKANKDERDVLLDILGVCGILQTADHSGFLYSFVKYFDRELPPQRCIDRKYPFCWWRGADGVNMAALNELFGFAVSHLSCNHEGIAVDAN